MKPTLEIFSQGEEVVTGQIVDSNAAWLSERAVQLGFNVTRHTAVGDKLEDLIALLQEIAPRADCCICTGGLGPTCDDLTTVAVSKAFELPLELDVTALKHIQDFFFNRHKTMPESNRKQALLPQGSKRLDNEWGTASGFSLQQGRCWFAFVPGVPSEMHPMFEHKILPDLPKRFSLQPGSLITIKTLGLGESSIQESLNAVAIPKEVQLGFKADIGIVQTKLLFPFNYSKLSQQALVTEIAALLGEAVFAIDDSSTDNNTQVTVIDKLMQQDSHTLAVIETVSCGMLSSLCIGRPWLISASYQQAMNRLGSEIINERGENSLKSTLKSMALDLQKTSGSSFALVQLYTGDDVALHDKNQPIELYLALQSPKGLQITTHAIAGSLERKQIQAALLSLDLLRRYLQFA